MWGHVVLVWGFSNVVLYLPLFSEVASCESVSRVMSFRHCLCPLPTPAVQIGWVTGAAPLMVPIIKAHQFLVFTVPSSLQRAVAHGLEHEGAFYRCVCGGGGAGVGCTVRT